MPLTRMQAEYLRGCSHRYNVKCGATGSGKSWVDVAVTIPQRLMAMRGEGLAVMIGNTRNTLERNILEPMRSLYSPDVVGTISNENTARIFGRKVYCMGAEKRTSVAKIQWATLEYVYGDEVATWSQEVFEMLKSRLRCEHSHFDGTCNPDSPRHWFKAFLDGGSDIFRQDYTIWDGALAPEVVEELCRDYEGTVYYDRYILGRWTLAEGLVYPDYEGAVERRYEGAAAKRVVSCDYGTQNAFAALLWAFDGRAWHVVDEYRYSGRDTGRQKTDQDYVEDMAAFVGGLHERPVFIVDPSAASFIEAMRRAGFKVRKARNDVDDGIRETSTCMKRGLVRISEGCTGLIRELGGYSWDPRGGGDRPVKVEDHSCDALRYGVATMRMLNTRKPQVNPLFG